MPGGEERGRGRMADRVPVIVGVGTSILPVAPDLDSVGHHVLAATRALADAGVPKSAIDGYCCAGGGKEAISVDDMSVMVEYLGLSPTYTDGTMREDRASRSMSSMPPPPFVPACARRCSSPTAPTN